MKIHDLNFPFTHEGKLYICTLQENPSDTLTVVTKCYSIQGSEEVVKLVSEILLKKVECVARGPFGDISLKIEEDNRVSRPILLQIYRAIRVLPDFVNEYELEFPFSIKSM